MAAEQAADISDKQVTVIRPGPCRRASQECLHLTKRKRRRQMKEQ
ncbi:hypothetical protein ACFOLK_16795 [Marinococcus halophilus]